MKDSLFTIGEVSKIKDISVKALRYYHKIGLLIPEYIDEKNNYRYYSVRQFLHIDIIKICRSLNLSIEEIISLFNSKNDENLLTCLNDKKEDILKEISNLQNKLVTINVINTYTKYSKNTISTTLPKIKYFKERTILTYELDFNDKKYKEILAYTNLDDIIRKYNINVGLQRGIAYKLIEDNAIPMYVFSIVADNDIKLEEIKTLPKGRYLVYSYTNEYEKDAIENIKRYLIENNISPEIFFEFELIDNILDINSYSCEVQIFLGK